MTFSIVARCSRTGMLGVGITTSSICVGSRCPWVRAGVGAVATQNVTDPGLGERVLDRLSAGLPAADALREVTAGLAFAGFRQLTAVDARGTTAHFTGERILGTHAVAQGESCVAAGNLLASTAVPGAVVEAFAAAAGAHLAERLLRGLEGGLQAGGEMGRVHSAALLVAHEHPWPVVDLRVDWHDRDPVAALRDLWRAYEPQIEAYILRAVNPEAAPSYAVPGDP